MPQDRESLPNFSLTERGSLVSVTVHAFAAGRLWDGFENRLAAAAVSALKARLGRDTTIHEQVVRETAESAIGTGGVLLLVAKTSSECLFGASCIAERGLSIDSMAVQAVDELAGSLETDACVDPWLQDQLILFAALASGTSFIRSGEPTLHTRTAMCVCQQLLPGCNFVLHRPRSRASASDSSWLLECHGVGYLARDSSTR